MKTFFKIFAIFIFLLFISAITIPIIFKNEIIEIVKEEINKNIKATVDWKTFSISLIKGFPDLKITLGDLSVIGIEQFKGDTLVAFDKLMANIDLFSVFSDKIKVKAIFLNKPVVQAICLADGSVNWDITYPSDEIEEPEDTSAMEMTINLKKIKISDGKISYFDEEMNMGILLDDLDILLTGDFSEKWTELSGTAYAKSFTLDYDGIKYIQNASLDMNTIIGADLVNYEFTFKDNLTKINELILGIEGMFGMPNDDDIVIDIGFSSKDAGFKSILSMIPAVYAKDFEGLKASGSVNFEGTIKGLVNDNELPKADISMIINNGYFSYPDLPKSVDNVNAEIKVFYDGVFEDNSTVDISKFHLEMGGNPVDMYFKIITPMSDMQLTGAINGKIDLSSLADVVPLEDTKLNGIIKANLELMGKMSDLEKENYQAFRANGLLEISDLIVSGEDIPLPVKIENTSMNFSPQYVSLNAFDAMLGSSDIHLNGRLENFIPYIFSDGTVKGRLELNSGMLNINELMAGIEIDSTENDDEVALSVVEIPKNVNFVFNSKIDRIKYDKLDITDLSGTIEARDGRLLLQGLSMGLLNGSMIMSGEYSTTVDKEALVDFNFNMNKVNIPAAFQAFNTVEKLTPIAAYCLGDVSLNFTFSSLLDSTMYPVLSSIAGKGKLQTNDVEIIENNTFTKMSQLVNNNSLKNPKFKDVNLSFDMRNGRLFISPFDVKAGTANLNIGGDQGIDQTMNYFVNMSIPRSEFGSTANDFLDKLSQQAASKGFEMRKSNNINLQVKITGSFTDPKFTLDVKESLLKAKADARDAIQERAIQEIEDIKTDVRAQVSEEINRIMRQAENEAEKIRVTAKEAGEKLVGEARLQGNNLIKEAGSNPIKRLAAQKAAEELEKTAKNQAEKLNTEAAQKATKLLQEAQAKADELNSKTQ